MGKFSNARLFVYEYLSEPIPALKKKKSTLISDWENINAYREESE